MTTDPRDRAWLASAARLALRGRPLARPNPAVGCVLVREGRVVGRGWTQPGGRPHAEAMALREAGAAARGATAYVTLEPCAHASPRGPCCTDELIAAGIARVVAAREDPDPRTAGQGFARLRGAGVGVEIEPCREADDSLAGYLMRQSNGRPFVTLKLATSLDGRIARTDGESRWITGSVARAHVHARRALADAICVGGGTWRADAPALDVRLPGLEAHAPRRLVLTRGGAPEGTEALPAPDAIAALEGVDHLYLEGGAEAAAAFLAVDLVDELHLYQAPILIGSGRSALGDIGLAALAEAHGRWEQTASRQLGSDRFTAYQRTR